MSEALAHFVASGRRIVLVRETPTRLGFGKPRQENLPFASWNDARPPDAAMGVARLLRASADREVGSDGALLVFAHQAGVDLHPDFIAALGNTDAVALGLPPATQLMLNLRTVGLIQRGEFRIEHAWTRGHGAPERVTFDDGYLVSGGRPWRMPHPLREAIQAVYQVNNSADLPARYEALAALKLLLNDATDERIQVDGVLERLKLTIAEVFSLMLRTDDSGVNFDPVVFSPRHAAAALKGARLDEGDDGLLNPAVFRGFARRWRANAGYRSSYLLDDGTILYLKPELATALALVQQAQAGTADARLSFATAPLRYLRAALPRSQSNSGQGADLSCFIETAQYADRAAAIDIWRKPVRAWVTPGRRSWVPDRFGLCIGQGEDSLCMVIEPGDVRLLLAAAQDAMHALAPTFAVGVHHVPASQGAVAALYSLDILQVAMGASPTAGTALPAALWNMRFLHLHDRPQDAAYKPLQAVAQLPLRIPSQPEGLRTQLAAHQVAGFSWIARAWQAHHPGIVLADARGLGKTLQALVFLAWLRCEERCPGATALVVVAPDRLADWQSQIAQHFEPGVLGEVVVEAGPDQTHGDPAPGDVGLVLTTYETLRDDHTRFDRQSFNVIIYDDAQALKDTGSQVTRSARVLNSRFQLGLLSQPMDGDSNGLVSLLDVLRPAETWPTDPATLYAQISQDQDENPAIILRRLPEDCRDILPRRRVNAIPVPMPVGQRNVYDRLLGRAQALKGTDETGRMFDMLRKLAAVSLSPGAMGGISAGEPAVIQSARVMGMFTALAEAAKAGEKAIVVCDDPELQALLGSEIGRRFDLGHAVSRLHGGLPATVLQAAIAAFQSHSIGFDALILSSDMADLGVDLSIANHVVHLSRWWDQMPEDSLTALVWRIGQKREVYVHIPQAFHPTIAGRSIDLQLDALILRRRECARNLQVPNNDATETRNLFELVAVEPKVDIEAERPEEKESPAPGPHRLLGKLRVPGGGRPASVQNPAPAQAKPVWPPRVAYEVGARRDLAIFRGPIDGDRIRNMTITDPFGATSPSTRANTIKFAQILIDDGAGAETVVLVTYDGEGRDRDDPEDNREQQADMQRQWEGAFPRGPLLVFKPQSRRINRALHDRHVEVTTVKGRKLIWDLGRGIDGVMITRFSCVVTFTEMTNHER